MYSPHRSHIERDHFQHIIHAAVYSACEYIHRYSKDLTSARPQYKAPAVQDDDGTFSDVQEMFLPDGNPSFTPTNENGDLIAVKRPPPIHPLNEALNRSTTDWQEP